MGQTRDEIAQNLAERLCWQVARRDDSRVKRRPYRKQVVDTDASVAKPLQPFDDYDDRSLIENCCIKESKQQWSLKHPPQKTAR
jgi:hypothetical protein